MRVSLLCSVASVFLAGAAFAQGEGEFPATLKGHAVLPAQTFIDAPTDAPDVSGAPTIDAGFVIEDVREPRPSLEDLDKDLSLAKTRAKAAPDVVHARAGTLTFKPLTWRAHALLPAGESASAEVRCMARLS